MSTVADVLREARELYAQAPSHAEAGGIPSKGTFCPIWALWEVAWSNNHMLNRADALLCRIAGTNDLATWNAENSTETVLAAFDRAIEVAS